MANTAPGRRQSTRQVRTSTNRPQNYYARNFSSRGVHQNADAGSSSDAQPGFCPAITHFTAAVDALPREVVKHFSMLKEVDAKLHAPDEELRHLADAIANLPPPPRNHLHSQPRFPGLSARNSTNGSRNGSIGAHTPLYQPPSGTQPSDRPTEDTETDRERQSLFFRLWTNFRVMAPILDEKIAVLSTANLTLERQLERMDSSYVHVPEEVSDVVRLGDPRHWAYVTDKETKKSAPERTRRDVANANTLAAAAAVAAAADDGEATMRSNARREAVAARKQRAHQIDSDFDDRPVPKKGPGKGRKAVDDPKSVGLGITNGAGVKRRKVTGGTVAMERSMSGVVAGNLGKVQASPRETPEVVKTRKKPGPLPKKKIVGPNSPRLPASSPMVGTFAQKEILQRPQTSRGRQNSNAISIQSAVVDVTHNRPSSPASNKAVNGSSSIGLSAIGQLEASTATDIQPVITPEPLKPLPEPVQSLKRETPEVVEDVPTTEVATPAPLAIVATRAGRTSKTATPMSSTFPDLQLSARNRAARNKDVSGSSHASSESGDRASRKKRAVNSVPESIKADSEVVAADERIEGSREEVEVEVEVEAEVEAEIEAEIEAEVEVEVEEADGEDVEAVEGNDPLYCYCNDVSYGEMVACDNETCPREWFHLKCAGLKEAPGENTKWYCDECKISMKEPKRSRPGSRRE